MSLLDKLYRVLSPRKAKSREREKEEELREAHWDRLAEEEYLVWQQGGKEAWRAWRMDQAEKRREEDENRLEPAYIQELRRNSTIDREVRYPPPSPEERKTALIEDSAGVRFVKKRASDFGPITFTGLPRFTKEQEQRLEAEQRIERVLENMSKPKEKLLTPEENEEAFQVYQHRRMMQARGLRPSPVTEQKEDAEATTPETIQPFDSRIPDDEAQAIVDKYVESLKAGAEKAVREQAEGKWGLKKKE
jgi:hypothetical protein